MDPTKPGYASQGEPGSRWRLLAIAAAALVVVAIGVIEFVRTAPVRGAVRAYTALIAAANRGDRAAVQALCSAHYLQGHRIEVADEGGVVGLPRMIHKNFRTWPRGEAMWICPGNRAGLVAQLVREQGVWKYDGIVGELRPGNQFAPSEGVEIPADRAERN